MKQQYETLLELTRIGIGHSASYPIDEIDWSVIQQLATEQGLMAVVLDGIEKLPANKRPQQSVLMNWIGKILQNYENRFSQYRTTIAELAGWYKDHDVKMMVLKGYACGLNWTKPEHRPYGDIDIWLFGKQQYADDCLLQDKGIRVDKGEHHHTVFYWGDFMVENHYDFLNIHQSSSNVKMEQIFKELGQDDGYSVEIKGERVYLPSPNLHALFLLKHSMSHFASEGTTMRQLLDWAFFVERYSKEIDWEWLENVLEEYGMKRLYDIYNAICIGDLGFDVNIFHSTQFDPFLKKRVLNDILSPEFSVDVPKLLLSRIIFKFRRWHGNAWKRELCYNESTLSSLWCGIKHHLLKPSTI